MDCPNHRRPRVLRGTDSRLQHHRLFHVRSRQGARRFLHLRSGHTQRLPSHDALLQDYRLLVPGL